MKYLLIISLFLALQSQKKWWTSFESSNDFKSPSGQAWYVENGSAYASKIDTTMEAVYHGTFSHKHWIDSARGPDNEDPYNPHRSYVTLQFQKSSLAYFGKTLITFYAWTDISLQNRAGIDDWFSLATITCDSSDNWRRTILINLTTDGYIRLVHVPVQGGQTHTFQVSSTNNPTLSRQWKHKRWNRVDLYLDTDSVSGKAIVWQNGFKVSSGNVRDCSFGALTTPYIVQAHFGMYASEAVPKGLVYNDKIRFLEVANDSVATVLVTEQW